MDEILVALRQNAATVGGGSALGLVIFIMVLKLLPLISSNIANIAASNRIQNEMLNTLRQERDDAIKLQEELRDKYYVMFREWSDLNAQFQAMKVRIDTLQTELTEAHSVIANLRDHVKKVAKASAPSPS